MEEQQPLPPAPSSGKVISDIFTSPGDVFQALKGTASASLLWVFPLIGSILVAVIMVIMMFTNESLKSEMKEIQSKAIQKMVDEGKMPQEQADTIESSYDSRLGMMIGFGIIGAAIFIALYFFGGALFLWLADKLVLKSPEGYGKHLELYGISSWIGVLGGFITLLMILGLGSITATPSAALAVFGNYDPTSNLHKVLTAINIFSIWQTAVIGIGLSKFSGKTTTMAMSVAFVMWVIWIAISVALGLAR
jgi:hypothetical protein